MSPDMVKYLCDQNEWTPDVFQSINWAAFQQAKNCLYTRKQQVIKLMDSILPTMQHKHKYDKSVLL